MKIGPLGWLILLWFCAALPGYAELTRDTGAYVSENSVFSVPLEIRDNAGVVRNDWPVTSGIPLPYGVVHDPHALRLTNEKGSEIPCQFSVLSRYGARDRSIRWILLDFQVDLPANGKTTVYLKNDKPAQRITQPIRVEEDDDHIIVDTGPLRATVPRTTGQLLESVHVDGLSVLQADSSDGPALRSGEVNLAERVRGPSWNTHGWNRKRALEEIHIAETNYGGGPFRPNQVVVEQMGPMRTVVLIKGRYRPSRRGQGIREHGFYNYTTRLHLYRGKRFIKVEHSIDNSDREQPQWNLMFREASLEHTLSLAGVTRVTGGGDAPLDAHPEEAHIELPDGEMAWLYQSRGHEEERFGRIKGREGAYRLGISKDGEITEPMAAGRQARFLDIADHEKGVAIAMRYFWQEAPRAVAASAKHLRVLLHADSPAQKAPAGGHRPEYDLDFGERYIHDVLYYFHTGDAKTARVGAVAKAFEYPLFAYAPPSWYADTRTWYFEIGRKPGKLPQGVKPHQHWQPTHIGARRHGHNRSYNSGGHHDSLNSGWLSFLRTGSLHELEQNLVLSRWSIAHNGGWAYKDNVLTFGDGGERYRKLDNALQTWDRLTGFGPKDFYLWRSDESEPVKTQRGVEERRRGGGSYLNWYKWLPDHEHYALFRLFEYYYLIGDRRALDALHGFVNWALNFQHKHLFQGKMVPLTETDLFERDLDALRRGHYSRVYTWMLFTNLAGFHATESPVMDEFARWQIRRMLALLRHRHGQLTSWDPKPSSILGFLPESWAEKISKHFDYDFLRNHEAVITSRAQSWMEAQGVLALHEAYKTYGDERILDGLWAQADYFSHHVIYFPRLGMLNNRTSMPNALLGYGTGQGASLTPQHHDRHIQAMPILYHYTGWPDMAERYRGIDEARKATWIRDWFLQTRAWEREIVPKHSSQPPERISDLRVIKVDNAAINLTWTSPRDDGSTGHSARYFVKYSDKPIVEFAPTDHPGRKSDKARIIQQAEEKILSRSKNRKRPNTRLNPGDLVPEPKSTQRWHPNWHEIDAFWMAEHVAGEPTPGPAGTRETFTVRELLPHHWFGAQRQPGLEILKPGTWYLAICSWDEDRNLSQVSNVVQIQLP